MNIYELVHSNNRGNTYKILASSVKDAIEAFEGFLSDSDGEVEKCMLLHYNVIVGE